MFLVFTYGETWFGWLVRVVTRHWGQPFRESAGHCYLLFPREDGRFDRIEASSRGVTHIIVDGMGSNEWGVEIDLPDHTAARAYAQEQMQEWYDWLGVLLYGLGALLHCLPIPYINRGMWTCSSLVAAVLLAGRFPLPRRLQPYTPNDLAAYFGVRKP